MGSFDKLDVSGSRAGKNRQEFEDESQEPVASILSDLCFMYQEQGMNPFICKTPRQNLNDVSQFLSDGWDWLTGEEKPAAKPAPKPEEYWKGFPVDSAIEDAYSDL